jgi:hypothetical protein
VRRSPGQNSGSETVARVHKGPKWVPHDHAKADSGSAQDPQDVLRPSLGKSCSYSRPAIKTELTKEKVV